MEKVNHINYPNDRGQIYCRRVNKVITLDSEGTHWDVCAECPMFGGDYQGMGVECIWEDNTENTYVSDPIKERLRVSKGIDKRDIPKGGTV